MQKALHTYVHTCMSWPWTQLGDVKAALLGTILLTNKFPMRVDMLCAHLSSLTAVSPSEISLCSICSRVALACTPSEGLTICGHTRAVLKPEALHPQLRATVPCRKGCPWRTAHAHLMPPKGVQQVVHVACYNTHVLHRACIGTGALHQSVHKVQKAEEQLLVQTAKLRPEVCKRQHLIIS